MGKPNTTKSKNVTVRIPISELEILESTGNQHGLTRHAVIRYLLTEGIQSGRVNQFRTKTPA